LLDLQDMTTARSTVQPGLIALGIAMVVVGALVLLGIAWQMATGDPLPVKAGIPAAEADAAAGSFGLLWPVLAGLLMAGGAAIVGIGMNRWFGRPRR
jgi:hypothetical protein